MWQKLQTLPNQQTHRGKIVYWHIRDGAVWHQHRKIHRADPATLEVFQTDGGSGFIARDKNHVYHAWTTLKNIGRASFEHIAAYLWRDKNHVYAEHETSLRAIAEADPATFRYLGNDWAADRHHAYYATRRVKHCTRLDTLRLIGACYAADADHVYWDGKLRCPCVLPRCPPCLLLLGPAPPSRPRKLAASARQLFQKTPPRLLRYTHHPPRKPRRLEHGTRPDHRCYACHAAHRPSPSKRYGSLKTAGFNEVKTRCPVFRLPMQATPKAA